MGVVTSLSPKDRLDVDYTLPIVSIPRNKTIPFIEWFLSDISATRINEIPPVFDKGYITVADVPHEFVDNCKSEYIKYVAKLEKTTFRNIENQLDAMYKSMLSNLILYYEFIDGIANIKIYAGVDGGLITTIPLYKHYDSNNNQTLADLSQDIELDVQDGELKIHNASCAIGDEHKFQDTVVLLCLGLFASAMWYMALYKNRYKYEDVITKEEVREKLLNKPRPTHVNNTKILTTSFYDLSKAPQSKVRTLMKKREGFEYSHQFNVSGHWRHYKSGKVIFIESFVKAKDKPPLQKNIILNPNN